MPVFRKFIAPTGSARKHLVRSRATPPSIELMEPRRMLSAAALLPGTTSHTAAAKAIKTPVIVKPATPAVAKRKTSKTGPAKTSPIQSSSSKAATGKTLKASPTAIVLGKAARPTAAAVAGVLSPLSGTGAVAPFTPAQIRHFYSADVISLNGVVGDGSGETIAIVDAYEDYTLANSNSPNFASSDLHQFDLMFNLPDPPSFSIVDEHGGTNLSDEYDPGWALETDLDVEWAHAMAPAANIVLVQCYSNSFSDLFSAGAVTAGKLGNVVSMSFGGYESDGDSSYDGIFANASTAAKGVTFVASAGDTGSGSTLYPALSPDVVAVGGTSIVTSDSNAAYGSETVWNNGKGATGGTVSADSVKPAFQANVTLSTSNRVANDVAFDADPYTGVYVLDTSDPDSATTLYQVGGTSLSAPCWAGLIAIADQGRRLTGLPSLDGARQTLPNLYQLPNRDFNDVVSGDNFGYSAGAGYDVPTGRGTPIASLLVPDLAGCDSIFGHVFVDSNADGIFDGTDSNLVGIPVDLNLTNNGVQPITQLTSITGPAAFFGFNDQPGGETGSIELATVPAGYVQVPGALAVSTTYDGSQGYNIGLFPIAYSDSAGSAGSAHYAIAVSNGQLQISLNGNVIDTAPVTLAPSLTFSLTGAQDSLTIDTRGGNPVPAGGLTVTGTAAVLAFNGSSSGDSFAVSGNSVSLDGRVINYSGISSLTINPGSGRSRIQVTAGVVNVTAPPVGAGILDRLFSSITVAAGASVVFNTAAAHADRQLIITANLTLAASATLDLGGNDMIVQNDNLAALSADLSAGFNNGNWNGPGIDSSSAASDPTHLHAVGVFANTSSFYGANNRFDGYAPASTDLLLKYTDYGDANLDGVVDGSDYSLTDNGYNTGQTSWQAGDFNYDHHVDGSDYTLLDNAFNTQQ